MVAPASPSRRRAIAAMASSAACLGEFTAGADGGKSTKKGWGGGSADLHRKFGAHWYYTWSPKTRTNPSLEFVPMIKGEWSLKQMAAIRSMKGITHLLGFNEPERRKQGNISLDRAVELWPRLSDLAQAKSLRLGSPAPSSDQAGMRWLADFMEKVDKQDLSVDFIAVHWYRSRRADEFEQFVDRLIRDYRLPIWITEFNGWSGPEAEHLEFLEESLEFLEKTREVERYAYFNPRKGLPHSLLAADGSLSRLGEIYRDC